jgi:hypothetical protein
MPDIDIDVEDFKSFLNSVETLLILTKSNRADPIELEKVRMAVIHDTAFFSEIIKQAEAV